MRPANDPAAATLANMASSLTSTISSNGHSLSDLSNAGATRTAVEAELRASRLIIFFGHGLKSKLQGAATDLVDLSNVSLASGNIIVAIACWSAHTLAGQAIAGGVEAYLGFDEQFGCLAGDPDGEFGAAVAEGLEELINGNDMQTTLGSMQQRFDDAFHFYKTGSGSGRSDSVLGWLLANWNKIHARLDGNVGTTL